MQETLWLVGHGQSQGNVAREAADVAGAPYLEFQPARSEGARIGKTVVLPVKFRVPSADTLRPDTLRSKR